MDRSKPVARDVALVLITAIGALAVIVGVVGLLGRASDGSAVPASGSSATAPPSRPGATATQPPAPSAPTGPTTSPTNPTVSPAGDPVLVGAGDIARCDGDGDEATAALLDQIPGTVFTAGDNVYDSGTPEEFERCYHPSWGRHRDRTRPTPGNHDHETRDLAGYLGYFGEIAGTASEPWYSWDAGTWHVVHLDSMCSEVPGGCGVDSAQVEWLRRDLRANPARCTLAIWHHPRFSSGEHGDDASVGPFWDALYEAGADLIVNGHDHSYERFAPQAPDARADPERGIRQFVVGTGGANLRGFPRIAPNSELRASVSHGVIVLTLHPTGYDWRFVATEGPFQDLGSAPCH
jgi:acid phosphatase type 7